MVLLVNNTRAGGWKAAEPARWKAGVTGAQTACPREY